MMWAALLGSTLSVAQAAPTVHAAAVGGPLGPGERGLLEVLVEEGGQPVDGVLRLTPHASAVLVGPGRWQLPWDGGTTGLSGTFTHGTQQTVEFEVPLRPAPSEPDLRWPDTLHGIAGAEEPVDILLEGSLSGRVEDVRAATAAGQLAAVRSTPNGIEIAVQPPPTPFPRAVPLLVQDIAAPGAPADLGVLVLRARTTIPVRTSPGTRVQVQLGGRSLPVVVADDDGVAAVSALVRPGEDTARLTLEDPAGNKSTSTIRLGGDPRPHLVGIAIPGQGEARRPGIVVGATQANGAPWTGTVPRCATPTGLAIPLVAESRGVWRGHLPAEADGSRTVDCHLGMDAQATLNLPPPPPQPERLVLRVSPPELDARAPHARVRAWVEDRHGDRLAIGLPEVTAAHGVLRPEPPAPGSAPPAGVALFDYDGAAAIVAGTDRIAADWSAPAGSGAVRDFDLAWTPTDTGWIVAGRALDEQGRPRLGAELVFRIGDRAFAGTALERGWVSTTVHDAEAPVWLTVSEPSTGRQRGAWLLVGSRGGLDWTAADLSAQHELRIVTGPIRRVNLRTDPPTLVSSGGRTARVKVALLDREGHPVSDVPVELVASRGSLTEPRRRPDGTIEAIYTPEREGDAGAVEILVRSPDEAFPTTATQLELVADDLRRAPGLHLGWLAGSDGLSSPWVGLDGDIALDALPDSVLLRVGVGLYGARALSVDPSSGAPVRVSADLVPVGVGLVGRQTRARLVTWVGGSALVVPYWLRVSVGETTGVKGLALAPPGAHAFGGAGLRTRTGQVDLSLGYVFITTLSGSGGWQGGAGGVLSTIGYRHAF